MIDLSSYNISILGEAYNISFHRDTNGYRELNFNVPAKIKNENGDLVDNFRLDFLKNEYRVKLQRNDIIYNFIIKKVEKQRADNGVIFYAVQCLDVAFDRLSRSGIDLYFDGEIGSAEELLTHVLQGSDWSVDIVDEFMEEDGMKKIRTLKGERSNRYSLIQELCTLFECFPIFNTDTKTVDLKKEIGLDRGVQVRYKKNLKNIKQILESNEVITKLWVEGGEHPDHGLTLIESENFTGENYILNFQYYIDLGLLTNDQVADINIFEIQIAQLNTQIADTLNVLNSLALDKLQNDAQKENKEMIVIAKQRNVEELNQKIETEIDPIVKQQLIEERDIILTDIATLTTEISDLTATIDSLNAQIIQEETNLTDYLQNKDQLIQTFELSLGDFIHEGIYQNTNYIDSNALYLDSLKIANRMSHPRVSYECNILNLSQLTGYDMEEFDLGDTIYIVDETLNINTNGRITEVDEILDRPQDTSIKISNYDTKVEDLMKKILTATTIINSRKEIYDRAQGFRFDGTLHDDLLQKTFDNNMFEMKFGTQNSVMIGKHGVLLVDNINPYRFMRLDAGGIALTADGGVSWQQIVSVDGMSALHLTGLITGEKLAFRIIESKHIKSETFTGQEFSATATLTVGTDNDVAILTGQHPSYRLFIGNQHPTLAPFSVTQQGKLYAQNAEIEGVIRATSGEFSGTVTVGNNAGIDGTSSLDEDIVRFWSGNDFKVYDSGIVEAGKLILTGDLSADNATLGGILKVGQDGILLDGQMGTMSSANFASGLSGWMIDRYGNSEFSNTKIRGQIESSVFVQNEIHVQGGSFLVRPAGILYEDVIYDGVGDIEITIENLQSGHFPMFVQDDVLRIKNSWYDIWLKVESIQDAIDYYVYTCSYLSGDTVFTLYKGEVIVNVGQTGSGGILLTSEDEYSPYMDIYENTTEPWLGLDLKVRLGNLEGIADPDFGNMRGYGLYSDNVFLKGSILLPDAGITNVWDEESLDSPVRFWAGASFVDRDNAPFRVLEDGSLYASKGIFSGRLEAASGTFSGTVDISNIVIENDGIFKINDDLDNHIVVGSKLGLSIYKEGLTLYPDSYSSIPYFSVAGDDIGYRMRANRLSTWDVKRLDIDVHRVARLENGAVSFSYLEQNLISDFDFEERTAYNSSKNLKIGTFNSEQGKFLSYTDSLDGNFFFLGMNELGYEDLTRPIKIGINKIVAEETVDIDGSLGVSDAIAMGKVQIVYNKTENSLAFMFLD